jgi:hypothetical protein
LTGRILPPGTTQSNSTNHQRRTSAQAHQLGGISLIEEATDESANRAEDVRAVISQVRHRDF